MVNFNKVVGGSLLVAGTCIGAGMLGLPVATAAGGFYPTLGAFILVWLLMTASAFLMLEVSLWYKTETNYITMAKATLGKYGAIIAWLSYVFFLYAIMTAYTAGSAEIISKVLNTINISEHFSPWIIAFGFGLIICLGAKWADWANRLVMLGLIVAYFLLVAYVSPQTSAKHFDLIQPKYLWTVGPLLVTSFGFHLLIPSLRNYLNSDVKQLRLSILIGSLIPLLVYILWEFIILGVIPSYGDNGLVAMSTAKQPIIALTHSLKDILQQENLVILVQGFSFCAVLSSLIGVSLGLFDFFADGFHIKKTPAGKTILAILTFFIPALLVAIPSGSSIFFKALRFAGIFAAVLLVIYPALMVWRGRKQHSDALYKVWGGTGLIVLLLSFGFAVIAIEILQSLDVLKELSWLPKN